MTFGIKQVFQINDSCEITIGYSADRVKRRPRNQIARSTKCIRMYKSLCAQQHEYGSKGRPHNLCRVHMAISTRQVQWGIEFDISGIKVRPFLC